MTDEEKKRIDNMDYRDMLSLWRFAPLGFPFFQGEKGIYFGKVMKEKKKSVDHVSISKSIGWDK